MLFANNNGFTLIELSIVILIIGALMGIVISADNAINSAKLRLVIKEVDNINKAIDNFRIKYGGLPGEISNATTIFGTVDKDGYNVSNGTDREFIAYNQENLSAIQQLALAGLITGVYTGAPIDSISQIKAGVNVINSSYKPNIVAYWIYGGNLWNNYPIGNSIVMSGTIDSRSASATDDCQIKVADAYQIDSKIDDGLPYTGKVVSYNPNNLDVCAQSRLSNMPRPLNNQLYLVNNNNYCTIHFAFTNYSFVPLP